MNGNAMLKNFLFDISGFTGTFTMQGREQECIQYIRRTVGNSKVLVSIALNDRALNPCSAGFNSTICSNSFLLVVGWIQPCVLPCYIKLFTEIK